MQLIQRDVQQRYRGSVLGVLWSLLNPLFTLAVFAVVFGVIYEGKFTGHPTESRADFALALFAGLTPFSFFSECLSRAPSIVTANPSYVTKVVFPLEILPVAAIGAGLVHLALSLLPLIVGLVALRGAIPWTALEWPLLLVPLVFWSLAVAWLGSALGVFLRDLQQMVATLTLVLMYASAIFYPISKAPEALQAILIWNPIAFVAESARNALIWGTPLDLREWAMHASVSILAAWAARSFFRRMQHAFADVI